MSTRRSFIVQTASAGLLAAANVPATDRDILDTELKKPLSAYRIPHTELDVSRIAFGCAFLIDWTKERLSKNTTVRASEVVRAALDSGITLFDLADVYGLFKAEQVVGEVLKQARDLRHKMVIQSKCGVGLADDWRPGDSLSFFDCSYEHIVRSVESSLKRLGTDYLDIFLLHYSDALVEPEEVSEAFEQLKNSGKVRYFGVSNHTPSQIELLKRYVRQPLVTSQVHLGLGHPDLIAEGLYGPADSARVTGTIDYCRLHDVCVQAHSPFRGGLMSTAADADRNTKRAAQILSEVAATRNTTRWVIALAWLLHHPAKIIPVFGTTNTKHVVDNCLADTIKLSREEWYKLLNSVIRDRATSID